MPEKEQKKNKNKVPYNYPIMFFKVSLRSSYIQQSGTNQTNSNYTQSTRTIQQKQTPIIITTTMFIIMALVSIKMNIVFAAFFFFLL